MFTSEIKFISSSVAEVYSRCRRHHLQQYNLCLVVCASQRLDRIFRTFLFKICVFHHFGRNKPFFKIHDLPCRRGASVSLLVRACSSSGPAVKACWLEGCKPNLTDLWQSAVSCSPPDTYVSLQRSILATRVPTPFTKQNDKVPGHAWPPLFHFLTWSFSGRLNK